MIRVLLADDHGLVRAGLQELLAAAPDIEVVGAAAGGLEAVELATRERPDVVLMDLSMPGLDGIAATRRIEEESPASEVVILTSFSDRERITDALDAGRSATCSRTPTRASCCAASAPRRSASRRCRPRRRATSSSAAGARHRPRGPR